MESWQIFLTAVAYTWWEFDAANTLLYWKQQQQKVRENREQP